MQLQPGFSVVKGNRNTILSDLPSAPLVLIKYSTNALWVGIPASTLIQPGACSVNGHYVQGLLQKPDIQQWGNLTEFISCGLSSGWSRTIIKIINCWIDARVIVVLALSKSAVWCWNTFSKKDVVCIVWTWNFHLMVFVFIWRGLTCCSFHIYFMI